MGVGHTPDITLWEAALEFKAWRDPWRLLQWCGSSLLKCLGWKPGLVCIPSPVAPFSPLLFFRDAPTHAQICRHRRGTFPCRSR